MNKFVFILAFFIQVISIFSANYFAELPSPFFFAPILIASIIMAVVYYFTKRKSMWSYLLLNCLSTFVYAMIRISIAEGVKVEELTYIPDYHPMLLVFAFIYMSIMTFIPIIPVCLIYKIIISKKSMS